MCWIEAKWRASEAAAKAAEVEQIKLIKEKLIENGILINGLKNSWNKSLPADNLEIEIPYLSNETAFTNYPSDTYRLASRKKVKGRIFSFKILSQDFIERNKLKTNYRTILDISKSSLEELILMPFKNNKEDYKIDSITLNEHPYQNFNHLQIILRSRAKLNAFSSNSTFNNQAFIPDKYINLPIIGLQENNEIAEVFFITNEQ